MQFNIPAEHKNASGVYIIRNTVNDKVYVGSAVSFWRRFGKHCSNLRGGKHHSQPLQLFYNKYSAETLSFELLEVVALDKPLIHEREQFWINELSCQTPAGFNIAPVVGSLLGYKYSPEQLAARIGRVKHSEETKRRMSEHRKQNPIVLTPAQRERQREAVSKASKSRTGKPRQPFTPEQRERQVAAVRAATKGKPLSVEHKQKLSESKKGKKCSPEKAAKISEAHKARIAAGLLVKGRPKGSASTPFTDKHEANLSKAAKTRRKPESSTQTSDISQLIIF